jgi:DsbC/DsbD-like thiol-disulfide interchange protein
MSPRSQAGPNAFSARLLPALAIAVSLGCADATAGLDTNIQSPWVDATNSKVRLISGSVEDDGASALFAGVQIRLDEGWKTYWRNPGDSGVPPSFDWSGSKNLKEAQVLYPAPRRFADASGVAIGYSGEVVFPVRVTPKRPGEPVELKLTVDYGLCKNLCIPNEALLTLELPPHLSTSGDNPVLNRFLKLVPKPTEPGQLPTIRRIDAKLTGDRPRLLIDTEFPANIGGNDLFIESADAFVPVPRRFGPSDGGKRRYAVVFASPAEAERIKGKTLTLTLVYNGGARETSWTAE